jgi:hypothetical protein
MMDAAIASVLPSGAKYHVLKAIEDPLYKATLSQQDQGELESQSPSFGR